MLRSHTDLQDAYIPAVFQLDGAASTASETAAAVTVGGGTTVAVTPVVGPLSADVVMGGVSTVVDESFVPTASLPSAVSCADGGISSKNAASDDAASTSVNGGVSAGATSATDAAGGARIVGGISTGVSNVPIGMDASLGERVERLKMQILGALSQRVDQYDLKYAEFEELCKVVETLSKITPESFL